MIQAVGPLIIVVVLLQVFFVRMPLPDFLQFLIGAAMVIVGLLLFLVGSKTGLLPMGEHIGSETANRGSVWLFLAMAFILGFAVTVAEPDVQVLAYQVDMVSGGAIPRDALILVVAAGVAVFLCLAMARILLRVPIAYLLLGSYGLAIVLSFFVPAGFVPIAFDSSGVTTGPVTVPFILALGLGTTAVLGGRSSMDGFGLVGLASVGPILGVMILGAIYGGG